MASLTILVADDTPTDRLILERIVRAEGHRVVCAGDGVEAVTLFEREQPDLVLLDVLMPEQDGFDAARQIKAIAGERLVPIIFLTSLTDTESLVRCLEAGGDDFLSKPYNRVVIQAKIRAFNRMRHMHATMLSQRDEIAHHNEHLLQEQAVAKQVFDNIAHSGCLGASNIRYFLSSLAAFNGDVLVAGMRPNGNMMVLLGDFTGHGLPAAIGGIPLASTFYGMVYKGFSMTDILREINAKLNTILPVGIFCCATMVDISFRKQRIKVWNGGLPESFIFRRSTQQIEAVQSIHLPLGVLKSKAFKDDCLVYELASDDRFYMWSDGIHEARNSDGEMYGEERLRDVFRANDDPEQLFNSILGNVQSFVGEEEKHDDLSLVEIRMEPPQLPTETAGAPVRTLQTPSRTGEWAMSFEVQSRSFRSFDPLPLVLNVLAEVPGLRSHSNTLYGILAELYSNALEHGVLKLDSTLKNTAEGFADYYEQRDQRLDDVDEGFIRIHVCHTGQGEGGKLRIRVEDSGSGFDAQPPRQVPNVRAYHGRGLALVERMCDAVHYLGKGNQVEAVYTWNHDDD
ncbi:ATP-binding SpoIIE family protein phosphatase [Marinimicrobium alkaliphilum]|uniref:ATP-binding SpoIIE family protein phosphatase n=1 Tax=Marinimicrobium alkaliphilum TaxID=2202654 RepID=UPI000DBA6FAD|nr:SpoIIE family protein phosphatase [Marinimicrobium alkaliphilum]